eukprot:jgi/Psemu1/248640/estExt_Genewise1.C_23270002
MILSVVAPRMRTAGEVDNPDSEGGAVFGAFIPSNVTDLVRTTQIAAILSYMIFADSSLMDICTGIEMFPPLLNLLRTNDCEKHYLGRILFACALRCIQGILAVFAVFLLVMTSSEVTEIILNFTAVTFISALDECAFGLAKDGKYGSMLEVAAKRIEVEPLPGFMCHKHRHVRYRAAVSLISAMLLGLICFVAFAQEGSEVWVTKILKIKFEDDYSHDLDSYSGCYNIVNDSVYSKRYSYNLNLSKTSGGEARLGYCKDDRRWVLFKKDEDVDDVKEEDKDPNDPCSSDLYKLAHSAKTDSFDIFNAFDGAWYSISNSQLSLSFSDLGSFTNKCVEFGNGKCDFGVNSANLNTPDFKYDEGDCCARTCEDGDFPCGIIDTAFGLNISSGYGFFHCTDPKEAGVPVILTFEEIEMAENNEMEDTNFTLTCNEFYSDEENKILSIPISGPMERRNETFLIPDLAACSINMNMTTTNRSSLWMIKYNIVYKDMDVFKISKGNISTN